MKRFAFFGIALCTACSLITAGTDLDSARPVDGGADETGGDGPVSGEGGGDAGPLDGTADSPPSDAPTSLSCEGDAHTLCDDFDKLPLADPSMWNGKVVATHGNLDLAMDLVRSTPRALSATMMAFDGGSLSEAFLSRTFTAQSALECWFQLHVPGIVGSGGVFAVGLTSGPTFGAADVIVNESEIIYRVQAAVDGGFETTKVIGARPTAGFVQLHLLLEWAPTQRARVWVGPAPNPVFDEAVSVPPPISQPIKVGITGMISPHPTWRVVVDDVVCDQR